MSLRHTIMPDFRGNFVSWRTLTPLVCYRFSRVNTANKLASWLEYDLFLGSKRWN